MLVVAHTQREEGVATALPSELHSRKLQLWLSGTQVSKTHPLDRRQIQGKDIFN